MPAPPRHSVSQESGFQSTDETFDEASERLDNKSKSHPEKHQQAYNVEQSLLSSSASPNLGQAPNEDLALNYQDYGAQQHPFGAQPSSQYSGFDYGTGVSLSWDWNDSTNYPDLANNYELQGELVQELQNQNIEINDFSIPLPLSIPENLYQSQEHPPNRASQTPLSPPPPPPKPPMRPGSRTSAKRKAESEPGPAVSPPPNPSKRPAQSRSSSAASVTSTAGTTASQARRRSSRGQLTAAGPISDAAPSAVANHSDGVRQGSRGTGPQGRVIDVPEVRRVVESPGKLDILPAGKVFPIQIGSELFRLSGASLASDAPSYFSHFFSQQLRSHSNRPGDLKTLYIDRDPSTFRDIALHLQGYHVTPRDAEHYVRLFADAQFYSLPRLTKQLFSTDIFIRIGGTPFQIPRDLFSAPGDSPNFFSLGFAQFFSTPTEVFPGLDRDSLLRPPSIRPPAVPNRNGETFGDLIKLLQGYDVHIKDDEHRSQLLRDARYFHLKGLEQRLIPSQVSYNLKRDLSEILIRLEDIRQSGISFIPDTVADTTGSRSWPGTVAASSAALSPGLQFNAHASPTSSSNSASSSKSGTVAYARPYMDDHAKPHVLILEISAAETTTLHFPVRAPAVPQNSITAPTLDLRATFHASTLARIASLFGVIASKLGLPPSQPLGLMLLNSGGGMATQSVSPANSGVSESRVRVRLTQDCYVEIDGRAAELAVDPCSGLLGLQDCSQNWKRKSAGNAGTEGTREGEWIWGGAKESAYGEDEDMRETQETGVTWAIRRAHWRLRVEAVEGSEGARMQVVLCGVRIEAFSAERSRNMDRGFLGK